MTRILQSRRERETFTCIRINQASSLEMERSELTYLQMARNSQGELVDREKKDGVTDIDD